jgi:hypothetical protein
VSDTSSHGSRQTGGSDAELAAIGVEPDDVPTILLKAVAVGMVVALLGMVATGYLLFKWNVAHELAVKGYSVGERAPLPGADNK